MFYIYDFIDLRLKRSGAEFEILFLVIQVKKINLVIGKFVQASSIAVKLAVYLSFPSPKWLISGFEVLFYLSFFLFSVQFHIFTFLS